MPKENLKHIPGTKIYLAGSQEFKLTRPENVSTLKEMGVEKVFLIYKKTPEGIKTAHGLGEEQERFFESLANAGIRAGTLLRDSHKFRDYESFHREAKNIDGRIVIECVKGKHASAAYASYHLAKATRLSFGGIVKRLGDAGVSKEDMRTVLLYLRHAGIDLKKEIERRDKLLKFKKFMKGIPKKRPRKKKGWGRQHRTK